MSSNYLSEMVQKAKAAMRYAYVPVSQFPVGACLRTRDNTFFAGCNLENASYSLTICAESSAIASMVAAGHRQISEIVVMAEKIDLCSPCGACRQRINEFATPETLIHLCTKKGVLKQSLTMEQLLPLAFKLEHVQK